MQIPTTPFHSYMIARKLGALAKSKAMLPAFASSIIDIYPYQIAAARFAMRSQYIKGCILCDEGSLGKTYEALLIATQRWYEGKDRILIVLPINLVSQWVKKIENGFSIPYTVWSNENGGSRIPESDGLIITTYDFALRQAGSISNKTWDMVIFDEADVLFKPENKTVISLKSATASAYKLLLTPTPITMSIMDIYGLIHFIDDTVLPDANDFYKRYFRKPENYPELTSWVSPFAFRTLKSQVTDYVNFTKRLPITIDYALTSTERDLYVKVEEYLALPKKAAYPDMDSYELNLMYYHVLSSSPKAFSKTVDKAISRLDNGDERNRLEEIKDIAEKAEISGKMQALLSALESCSAMLKHYKLSRKAIIFTNNLTTLDHLANWLSKKRYPIITSHNPDYIERFRNEKVSVLITTDTAAKGLDMEFCPIVINYDLLYNAVEIEQRISRCHRQGQVSDVVVINMLSKENLSDVRILELINKRTLQFDGIFGMSDDILGDFGTAIDKTLAQVRKPAEIQQSFVVNLATNKASNRQITTNAEDILFTTFTKSVADKVSITPQYISDEVADINANLWERVKRFFAAQNDYVIDDIAQTITLTTDTAPQLFYYWSGKQNKPYTGLKKYGMAQEFKPRHGKISLTSIISKGVINATACTDSGTIIVSDTIEPCEIGLYEVTITNGTEHTSYDVLVGITESGRSLTDEQCRAILTIPVLSYTEDGEQIGNWLRSVTGSSHKPHQLDRLVPKDTIIKRYTADNSTAQAEEIERIKLRAMRQKAKQEHSLADLHQKIKAAKQELASVSGNRMRELEIGKELKELGRILRDKEECLFFDKLRMDVAADEEIGTLTSNGCHNIQIRRHFLVRVSGG